MVDSGGKTYYSVAEAAKELNISRQAVLLRINTGTITAHRIGKQYMIERAEINRVRKDIRK